jgi:23S rRNA pseudoU1915 N3-methylase RlmH
LYFGVPWSGRKTNNFSRNLIEAISGEKSAETTQDMHMGLLAFGKMTIAHRLVRVLVLEQLDRGFRIVRGEPYHRE